MSVNGARPGGKGAFKYEGAGYKCMSTSKGSLKAAQGRMSGAHGTNGQSKDNNMSKTTGGYLIGKGTPTFERESYVRGGHKSFGQAKQPSGHKTKA